MTPPKKLHFIPLLCWKHYYNDDHVTMYTYRRCWRWVTGATTYCICIYSSSSPFPSTNWRKNPWRSAQLRSLLEISNSCPRRKPYAWQTGSRVSPYSAEGVRQQRRRCSAGIPACRGIGVDDCLLGCPWKSIAMLVYQRVSVSIFSVFVHEITLGQ